MFRNSVTTTPFTTSEANSFFKGINGDYYNRDVTFLSTLRALVAPRMAEGEEIWFTFQSSSYTASQLSNLTTKDAVRTVTDPAYYNIGQIVIHSFCSKDDVDNVAWMELMKSTFTEVSESWHLLEKVTEFYRKTFYVLCFINPELRQVVIFVNNLDMRKQHYLQCSIFAFLPWYFDPAKGVSENEMELIQSLREKTPERYEIAIAKLAESYDFRAAKIKRLLAGFETKYERAEAVNVRRYINDTYSAIERLNNQIRDCLKQKNDYEITLLGLEAKIAAGGDDSEIMDYFLRNQKVYISECGNDTLTFFVKDALTYFDEEQAKAAIENKNSFVYTYDYGSYNYTRYMSPEDMKRLMTAVFVDQTLKIKFCAAYRFNLNGSVVGLRSFSYGTECADAMPNPHIDYHACLGNNQYIINDLLAKREYIPAIEQSIASAKSLNFGDSVVMEEFMKNLYKRERNNNCIELPNGNVVDPKEAVAWLKAQENGETEEE